MRLVFVCFLEEIEDTKKTFRNYLTFSQRPFLVVDPIDEYRGHQPVTILTIQTLQKKGKNLTTKGL